MITNIAVAPAIFMYVDMGRLYSDVFLAGKCNFS